MKEFFKTNCSVEQALGKLAFNEEKILGFITGFRKVGTQIVYLGFNMDKISPWVSLAPNVLDSDICADSTVEMLRMKEAAAKSVLLSKMDPRLIEWKKLNVKYLGDPNGKSKPEDFQKFIEGLMKNDLNGPPTKGEWKLTPPFDSDGFDIEEPADDDDEL